MKTLVIHGLTVIVDDEDFEVVNSMRWNVLKNHGRSKQLYMRHSVNLLIGDRRSGRSIYMHRMLVKAQRGQIVDHINGNTLDNRKCNLRFVTKEQNARNQKLTDRNKTGYKGVSWSEFHKKYRAYIAINGKNIALGMFDDPKDGHIAYCEASKKYHGEFGRTE